MLRSVLLVLSFAVVAVSHAGTYFDKLSSTEQNQVLSQGQQLAAFQPVSGKPWPQINLSQWSDASPEQVCGVFADFNIQKEYMGDMLKSETHKVSQNTYDVDYELAVPVVSNEVYTVRNVFSAYDNGQSYKITWNLVKANRTKDSNGFFSCEPVSGGTFITYQNLVDPGVNSIVARAIYDKALAKVKATPYSVLKQLKKEAASNPAQLDKQMEFLRSTVAK